MKPSRRLLGACLGCLVLASPLAAGEPSFDHLVTTLSRHYQAKPAAGLGLATFIARLFTPSGMHRLRLAVFDQVPEPAGEGGGDRLEQLVREAVDPSYSPFIRVTSNPRQQCTYVFLRQDGQRFDLLLVNAERRKAVVMGMRLDPEALQKWVDEPERMARSGGRGRQPAGL
jgi:hypothetical protein